MAANDEDESTAVIVGVFAGILLAIVAITVGAGSGKSPRPVAPVVEVVATEVAPVGDALGKVYFGIGESTLDEDDKRLLNKVLVALAANPQGHVLLSGFHDPSGDPARNAELAKLRAVAVRDALVEVGVGPDRVKLRKPESTSGGGDPEEGRRVEIRVQ